MISQVEKDDASASFLVEEWHGKPLSIVVSSERYDGKRALFGVPT
jgi:hypothetical protein